MPAIMRIGIGPVKPIGIAGWGILNSVDNQLDEDQTSPIQANLLAIVRHSQLSVNAWAQKHHLTQSTVSRILNGKLDPTTKLLQKIAQQLGLQAWQLLVPGFEPSSPPTLSMMSAAEAKLYEKLQRDIRAISKLKERNTDF